MLAIRMQRTGRKGHAMFRIVVQDSRRTPSSGNVVAALGHYDPHAKTVTLDKEKAAFYLQNGAQPSDRVIRIMKSEGVTLPDWVVASATQTGKVRNPEKLRRNQPKEEIAPETPVETIAEVEPEITADVESEVEAATEEA